LIMAGVAIMLYGETALTQLRERFPRVGPVAGN
jgi:hypothetical protein